MPDNQTLELPQVFSRSVGPIPPVSVFQGYNPQTMAQVEGPYRGGWTPLMQDPVTIGAMGPTMGLGQMFANAAYQGLPQLVPQRGMPQPSIMSGYRPGWQKIPNTTEPQLPNWPTMPELSGPKGMGPIGGPATNPIPSDRGTAPGWYHIGNKTNPFPYTPDPTGSGWTRVGSEGKPDTPDPRPNYADMRQQMQQRISDAEKLSRQVIPIEVGMRPVSGGGRGKIIWTPPVPSTVGGAISRFGTPEEPAMPTQIIGQPRVVQGQFPEGEFQWGAPATTRLPSITDLFGGIE